LPSPYVPPPNSDSEFLVDVRVTDLDLSYGKEHFTWLEKKRPELAGLASELFDGEAARFPGGVHNDYPGNLDRPFFTIRVNLRDNSRITLHGSNSLSKYETSP